MPTTAKIGKINQKTPTALELQGVRKMNTLYCFTYTMQSAINHYQ